MVHFLYNLKLVFPLNKEIPPQTVSITLKCMVKTLHGHTQKHILYASGIQVCPSQVQITTQSGNWTELYGSEFTVYSM